MSDRRASFYPQNSDRFLNVKSQAPLFKSVNMSMESDSSSRETISVTEENELSYTPVLHSHKSQDHDENDNHEANIFNNDADATSSYSIVQALLEFRDGFLKNDDIPEKTQLVGRTTADQKKRDNRKVEVRNWLIDSNDVAVETRRETEHVAPNLDHKKNVNSEAATMENPGDIFVVDLIPDLDEGELNTFFMLILFLLWCLKEHFLVTLHLKTVQKFSSQLTSYCSY